MQPTTFTSQIIQTALGDLTRPQSRKAPLNPMKSLFRHYSTKLCSAPSVNSLAKTAPLLALVIGIFLGTNTTAAQPRAKALRPTETSDQSTLTTTTGEVVSNSKLTGELLLEILLGELNNSQGVPATGYSLLLDAARKSQDEGLYKRAIEIALRARSGPSALEAARAWKGAAPASKEANRYVLDILLALNKVEQSEEPLKSDIALNPQIEQPKVIAQIPQLYSQVNDKSTAATVVERSLSAYKTRSDTEAISWITIAKMRQLASMPESSLQALKKGLLADPQSALGTLLAIELASTHTAGAEDLLKPALQNQTNPSIRLQWVRSLIEMDRLNDAGQQLSEITQKFPEFPDAWLLLGSLQVEQSQVEKAEGAIKTYLKIATQSPDLVNPQGVGQAYLMLAQIAQKQNNENLANTWLSKIEDPQLLLRAQFQRASILASKGKLPEAVELIDRLPNKSREDARSKALAKAQLYRDYKDYENAYNTLDKYLKTNPNDVDISYEMSMIAEKLKRYPEMERILRSIIATHPDYAQAYNALGFSLADRNLMLTEAKKLIVKALELLPEDPFITDSLGWVEFRLGNNVEAIAILQRAYAGKSDPEIAAHLGEVMWLSNKNEEALQIWREAMKISPDNELLKDTIARLKAPI